MVRTRSLAFACFIGWMIVGASSALAQPTYQGFEVNTGDWFGPIARVASGAGILGRTSYQGNFHAEIQNVPDSYALGFGGANFSFFDVVTPAPYKGDYSQTISMYIDANWAPAAIGGTPSFWIDMAPLESTGNQINYGGEHNFRLTATGTSVIIQIDGQVAPIGTITASGWYTFTVTYRKNANPALPMMSDMYVFAPNGGLFASATNVGPVNVAPCLPNICLPNSGDLGGPGIVWITVWQNGFAAAPGAPNGILAIDAVRTDLLPAGPVGAALGGGFRIRYASNLTSGDSLINITNTGENGAALNGPNFGPQLGNICVNVYAFSPDEQLIACCSCLVTPNGLMSLSVVNDLISNTLTGVRPNSVVVKLLTTLPGTAAGGSSTCANSAAQVNTGAFTMVSGFHAWGTTLHAAPAANTFDVTETPFLGATASAGEIASITNRCTNIIGNGSTFGICRSCRSGGLGAARQ